MLKEKVNTILYSKILYSVKITLKKNTFQTNKNCRFITSRSELQEMLNVVLQVELICNQKETWIYIKK